MTHTCRFEVQAAPYVRKLLLQRSSVAAAAQSKNRGTCLELGHVFHARSAWRPRTWGTLR